MKKEVLSYPQESDTGNRKYSFSDVELIINIAKKREDGIQTFEIKQELKKEKQKAEKHSIRNKMIQGQLNVHFGLHS